ncbi:hypothetical protein EGW08_007951 [Elysia chlorotica]|uniref:Band 7 domain-containing protein n=1 Tax=Elysia chlorotica TaxID=188477 RepID=A0A433TRX1_ELYCH|nr:hypothetical protein EGW08_007951 [Elysia chlorotica]
MSNNKPSGDEGGSSSDEDEVSISVKSALEPPPSYDDVVAAAEPDEERGESSDRLLQGQGDGPENAEGGELSVEEKRRQHEHKIRKLIADLRRECSVEEVAPEELEMLNVGDDDLTESEMSSALSSARERREPELAASEVVLQDREIMLNFAEDNEDASLRRLSKRSSMLQASTDVDADGETDAAVNNNDVEHPTDEVSVEDGEERPKRLGILALVQGSPTRKLIVLFTVLFCLGLLLLVILLPKSFVYVEYHQYALSKNTWTEAVDYSTVYDGGCYLLAPQDELIRFDATAHFVQQSLDVSDDTGLSIEIDITLQYFLKRDEVPRLFQKYHHGYYKVINSLVESAVKNVAVKFTLEQYRLHRQKVEADILTSIRQTLSGDCCDSCCPDKCGKRDVDCGQAACRPIGSCRQGHHVTVKYFQLGAITIPETVMDRHVQKIVLQVEADRELFYQQKAIEVKRTERMAQDIKNQAEELKQAARAQDRVIRAKAQADKSTMLEKAQQDALRTVFSSFNISDEAVKLSYIYAHALADNRDNLRFTYAYQNLGAYSP